MANNQINWEDLNPVRFLITGSLVTVSCDMMLFPCDLTKTRLQLLGSSTARLSYPPYTGAINAIKTIRLQETWRGLYKGFSVSVCGSVPSDVIYYGTYEFGKYWWKKKYREMHRSYPSMPSPDKFDPFCHMFMGACAELVSSIVWIPTDIITQKMMAQGNLFPPRYKNGLHAARTVLKNDGFRGLYRGGSATLTVFATYSALCWAFYEHIRKKMYKKFCPEKEIRDLDGDDDDLAVASSSSSSTQASGFDWQESLIHCSSGTMAGMMAATLTNPLDVIKTRLQVQDYFSRASGLPGVVPPKYTTPLSMGRAILREEGALAFTKGITARIMYVSPVCAFMFFTYETIKRFAQK